MTREEFKEKAIALIVNGPYSSALDAIIDLCMEEAAMVCEENAKKVQAYDGLGDLQKNGYCLACFGLAAAIRALKEKQPE